jgi:hypothetical protein
MVRLTVFGMNYIYHHYKEASYAIDHNYGFQG